MVGNKRLFKASSIKFLILGLLFSAAIANAATKEVVKDAVPALPQGYLDKELAKDPEAAPIDASKTNSSKKNARKSRAKTILKDQSKNQEGLPALNVPSEDDMKTSSAYNSNDWVPKTVKSDKSKKLLEKYHKEEENLVNELLSLNYDTYVPPKQLYGSHDEPMNRHLPHIYNKSDYFDMALNAVKQDNENALRAAMRGENFLNRRNQNGDSLLIYAIQNNSIKTARILLGKGALIDEVNNRQRTALHYAAALGNEDTTKLLLSMGATPNMLDDVDMTPMDYALLENQENIVKIIKQYMGVQ